MYTSVWGMVEAGESDGVAAYAIAMNELDSLVVPVADQPHSHMCGGRFAQRPEARRVVVLYADACTAKPGFDAELLELERRCKSAGVEMGQMIVPQNPKDIARVSILCIFTSDCLSGVRTRVRALVHVRARVRVRVRVRVRGGSLRMVNLKLYHVFFYHSFPNTSPPPTKNKKQKKTR